MVARLIEALESEGYDPSSYSGRGMYGKSCVAVRNVTVWEIAKTLFTEEYDGEFDDLPEPQQDQLGRGIVLYWPSYAWPEDKTLSGEDR